MKDMNPLKPNLFLVGAPKCGTSSMHEHLRQHPEIFMCVPKEPHYFGADHHRINHTPRTEAEYLALFSAADGHKWIGDASTSYLHSIDAAREIRDFSPKSKIIVMLRNPVDVMYAYHSTNLSSGFEFIADFATALDAEDKRRHGRMLPRHRPGIVENLCYRDVARFACQLQRYFDLFGRERVHVIVYDDFTRQTAGVYRKVLEFLEVDPDFTPIFERINVNRAARSVSFNNFLWNPPQSLQSAVQRVLPKSVRLALGTKLKGANLVQKTRPPMNPDLRRKLNAEYAPEVERLSELLHRDLTHWYETVT